MDKLTLILEALVLSAAVSVDAFVASFAYGSNKTKIPFISAVVIDAVCGLILSVSLFAGSLIRPYIPHMLTVWICFAVLMILGVVKLLDSMTKSFIRRHKHLKRKVRFSLFNFRFVLSLYADPEAADVDKSKTISPAEAVSLAVALSLDGMAVGFGAAMGNVSVWAVLVCSLITGLIAVLLGVFMGNRIAKQLPFNLSWLSGAVLIVLAIIKLI